MGWGLCRKYFRFWELSMKNSNKQKLKNVLSPLQHDPIADGCGNIAPHHHYSSSTHMDSQTLPTHSVLFLSLLIQTIFAMGRCCSLSTRSTCRNPRPTCTHHHRAPVHLLYPIPYASILYTVYILLPPPTMFFCSYSHYPCNSNTMSTVYTH